MAKCIMYFFANYGGDYMASNYDIMRDALTEIKNVLRYDTVIDEDGTIIKDCGDYLQMIVPIKNSTKGYNTYDIYYENNRIKEVLSHRTNAGPIGRIFPKP